eukprot:TRINITY_DN5366_c0_g1_i1.p1 TRINITY_DN5366_c0_g1~~TRINITY_DN5366_c0_g1_i1.p1  ORF type:complete len:314 (-),score=41.10 TRINITY_DN5366_c0_g1_i1:35-976(-)
MEEVIDLEFGDDELLHIFEFLSADSLLAASQVSSQWYWVAQSESLWKSLCYSEKKIAPYKPDTVTWKEVYRMDLSCNCPHLIGIRNEELLWLGESLKGVCDNPSTQCSGHEERCPYTLDFLWYCMNVGCGNKGCGRRDKGHALEHFQQSGHPLYIKLNTLELWCHACQRWIGDQDSNVVEIAQAMRIKRCVQAIAKPRNIDIEMERRRTERCLPGGTEAEPIRYMIGSSWLDKWIRFIIGDATHPEDPIDNREFLTENGRLREDLPPFALVSEEQWKYFQEHYEGGWPEIKIIFNRETQMTMVMITQRPPGEQ